MFQYFYDELKEDSFRVFSEGTANLGNNTDLGKLVNEHGSDYTLDFLRKDRNYWIDYDSYNKIKEITRTNTDIGTFEKNVMQYFFRKSFGGKYGLVTFVKTLGFLGASPLPIFRATPSNIKKFTNTVNSENIILEEGNFLTRYSYGNKNVEGRLNRIDCNICRKAIEISPAWVGLSKANVKETVCARTIESILGGEFAPFGFDFGFDGDKLVVNGEVFGERVGNGILITKPLSIDDNVVSHSGKSWDGLKRFYYKGEPVLVDGQTYNGDYCEFHARWKPVSFKKPIPRLVSIFRNIVTLGKPYALLREQNETLEKLLDEKDKSYFELQTAHGELQQVQSELVKRSSKELLYDAGLSYSLFGQAFGKGDVVVARDEIKKVMRLLKEYLGVCKIAGGSGSVPSVELGLAAAEMSYSQMEPQSFSLLRKAEERKVGGNLSFYRKGEGDAEGKFVKQFKLVPSAVSDIEFLLWNMQNPDFRKELKTPLVLASDFYSVVEGGEKREAAFVLEEEIVGSSLFDFVNKLNTRSGDDYSVLLKDRLVNKCLRSVAFFESEYEKNGDLRNLVGVLRDHSKPEVVRYDDKLFDVFQNYLNIDFGGIDSGVVDKLRFSFSQIHDALSKHSASPCLDFSPRNVRVGLKHAYLNLRAKQGATVDSCLEELGRAGNLDDFVLDYVSSGVGKGFSASDVLHAFEDSLYFVDFEKLASTTTSNDEVIHIVESPVYAFGDSVKKGKDVLYLAYLKNFLDGGKHAQQVSALEKGEVVDTGFLSGFDHNGFVASRDLMSFYRNMRWVKWLKGLLHEEQYCSFHLGEACNSLDKEVSKASSAGITLDSRLEDLAGSGSGLEFTKCFLDKYVGDKFL